MLALKIFIVFVHPGIFEETKYSTPTPVHIACLTREDRQNLIKSTNSLPGQSPNYLLTIKKISKFKLFRPHRGIGQRTPDSRC